MKESCKILLQTMPDHMNIDEICQDLMKTFPDIVNVHELHIWQLTEDKIISTAHIIFLNPKVRKRVYPEFLMIKRNYKKQKHLCHLTCWLFNYVNNIYKLWIKYIFFNN